VIKRYRLFEEGESERERVALVAADAGVECNVRKRTKASRKTEDPLPILTISLAIRNAPLGLGALLPRSSWAPLNL
jgi:hypothetical protein